MPNKISEPLRSILIVLFFVVTGVFGVLGQHFADNAKTAFGWTLWDILTGVGILGFVVGLVILYKKSYDK